MKIYKSMMIAGSIAFALLAGSLALPLDVGAVEFESPEINFDFKVTPSFGVYIHGVPALVMADHGKNLAEKGFSTTENLADITLAYGEVSEQIPFTCEGADALIQFVNPYENPVSLEECLVCDFYTEDTTGVFSMDSSNHACGTASHEDVEFNEIYSDTPEQIIYKQWVMTPVSISLSMGEDPKGEQLLKPNGNCDVILSFAEDKMKSFEYLMPELCYNGMQNNASHEDLQSVDASKLAEMKITRDSILDELKAAFKEENISVNLDDKTGEITMDNAILFDFDSADISPDGKQYMNQFMKTYLSILFSDTYKNRIKAICFEGHTDSSGEFAYNLKLSQLRADNVMNYCIADVDNGITDVDKATLKEKARSKGYSFSNLVYDEGGKEDAAASRRVAIKFYLNLK